VVECRSSSFFHLRSWRWGFIAQDINMPMSKVDVDEDGLVSYIFHHLLLHPRGALCGQMMASEPSL
jgi:hypothetical protein